MSNVISSLGAGAAAAAAAGIVGVNYGILAEGSTQMKKQHTDLLALIEEVKGMRAKAANAVTGKELEQIDLLIHDMEEKATIVSDNIAKIHNHVLTTSGTHKRMEAENCNTLREFYERMV